MNVRFYLLTNKELRVKYCYKTCLPFGTEDLVFLNILQMDFFRQPER